MGRLIRGSLLTSRLRRGSSTLKIRPLRRRRLFWRSRVVVPRFILSSILNIPKQRSGRLLVRLRLLLTSWLRVIRVNRLKLLTVQTKLVLSPVKIARLRRLILLKVRRLRRVNLKIRRSSIPRLLKNIRSLAFRFRDCRRMKHVSTLTSPKARQLMTLGCRLFIRKRRPLNRN